MHLGGLHTQYAHPSFMSVKFDNKTPISSASKVSFLSNITDIIDVN